MTEITITIKTIQERFTKKFLVYKTYTMDANDPYIREILDETKKSLYIEPDTIESITIRSTLVVQ